LAVLAAEVLSQSGLKIADAAIEEGLLRASWPGRLQVLRKRPLVICDGAHNASGVRALVRNLDRLGVEKAVTVFGALRDKNYDRMLGILADRTDRFVFTKPVSHRALPVARLARAGREAGVVFTTAAKSDKAIEDALKAAAAEGSGCSPVLVCGSLYLVGEAMQFFGFKPHLVRLC
jgi:dihydrofolate synthase/folylpolyglutamate synthase